MSYLPVSEWQSDFKQGAVFPIDWCHASVSQSELSTKKRIPSKTHTRICISRL